MVSPHRRGEAVGMTHDTARNVSFALAVVKSIEGAKHQLDELSGDRQPGFCGFIHVKECRTHAAHVVFIFSVMLPLPEDFFAGL